MSTRRTGNRNKTKVFTWDYLGGKGKCSVPQKVFAGEVVESDLTIFDRKGMCVGTTFKLKRIEGGFVYGSVVESDGTIAEVKKTCGHIRKYVPCTRRTRRRGAVSNGARRPFKSPVDESQMTEKLKKEWETFCKPPVIKKGTIKESSAARS